jgi:hypothetical protein
MPSLQLIWVRGWFPWFQIDNRPEYESTTREYDDMAWRYLSWVLYPCLAIYAIYSLVYDEHNGVYSYIVGVLAGAVYIFGMYPLLGN